MPEIHLSRLVYRSFSTITHNELNEVDLILESSARHNKRDGITGTLALINGRFIQALEGERNHIDALVARIKLDDRHQGVTVLGDWPITSRLFAGWAMARLDASAVPPPGAQVLVEERCGIQVVGTLAALREQMENSAPNLIV